ncbi:Histone acetyltransferase GCN5 [Apostasia shenzhenica]|uniref:Histone acetyltransferase GCN5 n=1 Tax=Apostasia shenzhenica TaxID=1088818 RepID=A0A2I0BGV1_9ASPA|nr:Histone acetyltransferase GCN5 [Apostasia shenzhenica]
MAGRLCLSSSPISIGNCKVEIEGSSFCCELTGKSILISTSNDAKIQISDDCAVEGMRTRYFGRRQPKHDSQGEGTRITPSAGYAFALLNPKDSDNCSKSLLQEVLNIYMEELPTMNYAANTGKESQFLLRCLSSGKYNTLMVTSSLPVGSRKVIAAITYQIIPADTQYAEIPLAAVTSNYQRKGIGHMMYEELKERLRSVGVLTMFCWADKESEQFWLKQSFVSVGEVDGKGKARKLPVKANIRKALCFPGAATLMVANLKMSIVASDTNEMLCYSMLGGKGRVWEASFSSLKSKRVKGSHLSGDFSSLNEDLDLGYVEGNDACFDEWSKDASKWHGLLKEVPQPISHFDCLRDQSDGKTSAQENADQIVGGNYPTILLMNIADDDKREKLMKIVGELGGSVTSCGSSCTHVITGKARRTLNFCLSLCSGAWIVSPSWLKSSFQEGRFLDELPHILEDEDYLLKYSSSLRDVIGRAKANPHSLLSGYQVCLSKHIQPSIDVLSSIISSAGGCVIRGLRGMLEPSRTIFLACEEDMQEALLAAKTGVRTFSTEWLINCVMRQELDLDAHQFAESL